MLGMKRYLGFNLLEWMWIVFVGYTAFLTGTFNEWRSPSPGLAGFLGVVITPLLFTGLLGVGPALLLRAGVRLVDRMNGARDPAEGR